ncbi:MAG: hypothetical protein DSY82_05955 [Flavobacteriia bacterium]|nr:MAG: hypothetical protein DSY82_05955 [Flavobacteriia bacterium]
MDQEKDILKKIKTKGTGFKIPENYLKDFTVDLPEEKETIIPKETGFKVPENYFNQLDKRLIKENVSTIPKNTGYKVPDGYFKDFEVKTASYKENKVIQLFKKNRKNIIGFSIAASILLLFSIFPLFDKDKDLDFNSLSDNDIETWLDLNADQINSFELAELIDDNDDLYAVEMISEEDISDYLIETDVESWIPDN